MNDTEDNINQEIDPRGNQGSLRNELISIRYFRKNCLLSYMDRWQSSIPPCQAPSSFTSMPGGKAIFFWNFLTWHQNRKNTSTSPIDFEKLITLIIWLWENYLIHLFLGVNRATSSCLPPNSLWFSIHSIHLSISRFHHNKFR